MGGSATVCPTGLSDWSDMTVGRSLGRSLSRDAILAVNNRRRYAVLDWETRDVIARLPLRRRGCRAGEHCRRQLAAAKIMTSSVNCVDEGIPTILGNRRAVNKQHQLFHGRSDSRATVLRVIENGGGQSQHSLQKLNSKLHLHTSKNTCLLIRCRLVCTYLTLPAWLNCMLLNILPPI